MSHTVASEFQTCLKIRRDRRRAENRMQRKRQLVQRWRAIVRLPKSRIAKCFQVVVRQLWKGLKFKTKDTTAILLHFGIFSFIFLLLLSLLMGFFCCYVRLLEKNYAPQGLTNLVFELMKSGSWRGILCHWDTLDHTAISDFTRPTYSSQCFQKTLALKVFDIYTRTHFVICCQPSWHTTMWVISSFFLA